MIKIRGLMAAALMVSAPLAMSGSAIAQEDYPSRDIEWIVPSSPGSGYDVVARLVTPKLSEVLGVPVVVENIAGAGGSIGASEAATAEPDGYTLLHVNLNQTAAEALYQNLSYNLLEDFEPVIRFAKSHYVFVVNPEVEAQNLEELLALAKEKPGELNFASAGVGSTTFMVGQSFKSAADIDITHIPYEGGGPALASVVAGETQIYGAPYATAKPFIEDGKVRAIAVASAERLPYLPDVPAVSETIPGYELTSWYGVVVPTGTPDEVKEKIRTAMAETVADPKVKKALEDLGMDVFTEGPEEFGAFLKKEVQQMKDLVEEAGIPKR